jgi:hypothetical protein
MNPYGMQRKRHVMLSSKNIRHVAVRVALFFVLLGVDPRMCGRLPRVGRRQW